MDRELLEKPFEPGQVKQRVGTFGSTLDYIEGHAVIRRLNEAFDGKWSFEILEHRILEEKDEVIVLGKLAADGVVKTQFGSSRITRAKETGEIISIADDMKAAGTDSLKKCATLFGVGLYLYQEKGSRTPANGVAGPAPGDGRNRLGKSDPGNGGNGGNARITNRQLNYIVNLGKNLGMNSKDLDQESIETFGTKIAYLTVHDASAYIERLKMKAM